MKSCVSCYYKPQQKFVCLFGYNIHILKVVISAEHMKDTPMSHFKTRGLENNFTTGNILRPRQHI